MSTNSFFENIIKPPARAVKYGGLQWLACQKANWGRHRETDRTQPVIFIFSCGRSGTTVLGNIFAKHPQVRYFFEPHHLWFAIDRHTDILGLFSQDDDRNLILDRSDYSPSSQLRFNRLIRGSRPHGAAKIAIDKSPLHIFRLGYLDAISPGSKFLHLVRDGVEVSHSVNRLASGNTYKIAGKPALNQWWGVNESKWKALARSPYYPSEIHHLETHLLKAAYEWLVGLGEIDRWREHLGDRFGEVTYDALATDPTSTLTKLCEFFEIDAPPGWLAQAKAMVRSPTPNRGISLSLPPMMCEAFNGYQERYGFPHRAQCGRASGASEASEAGEE